MKETIEIGTKQPSLGAAMHQMPGKEDQATGCDLGTAMHQKPGKRSAVKTETLKRALRQ